MNVIKWLGLGVVGLVVLAVAGMSLKFYVLSPKSRPAPQLKAPSTPEAIARGKYLAHHVAVCVGCHSPVDESQPGEPLVAGKEFGGRDFGDYPDLFPGHIRAPNLSADPQAGLGGWTDGEIVRAMREGVSKDGRPLFPMMPYLTYAKSLSDDDALAIVAYLRTVPPQPTKVGPTTINFPISMFVRAAPRPLDSPPPPAPASGLDRGKWLLEICSCGDCHTTTDAKRQPVPGHYLAGGTPLPLGARGMAISPNITSEKATGIGTYTDADLARVFNEGVGKSGRNLYGMPWWYYKGLTDSDKQALIQALREVPPVVHAVPPSKLKL